MWGTINEINVAIAFVSLSSTPSVDTNGRTISNSTVSKDCNML